MPDQELTRKQQRELKYQAKLDRREAEGRKKKSQQIITWSIVGAVIVGLIVLVVLSNRGASNGTVNGITDQDHVRGQSSASVLLVEYSDFQCPACGSYYPIVKGLESKYTGGQLAVVYRHFPLRQNHQYAQIAAQASEAASLQGKFWEMHDQLFDNQSTWSGLGSESAVKDTFASYAKDLGLDQTQFNTDIDSQAVKDRVQSDVDSGTAANILGTPTFYLNGTKINNPKSIEDFAKEIDKLLNNNTTDDNTASDTNTTNTAVNTNS